MSNELPYLPFFVSDFLVAVGTWPADRVGAYTLALCYQFEHGGLPADDERELSRIMHTSRPVTRRLWLEIGAKFQRHDDGLWWNPRLEEVRAVAREQVAKASGRGRKGAAARWGKGANSSLSITQALPEHCLSNAQAMPVKVNTSTPPLPPPLRRGARSTRHVAIGDEQRRKTHKVQELIASGMSREDANRQVFK